MVQLRLFVCRCTHLDQLPKFKWIICGTDDQVRMTFIKSKPIDSRMCGSDRHCDDLATTNAMQAKGQSIVRLEIEQEVGQTKQNE